MTLIKLLGPAIVIATSLLVLASESSTPASVPPSVSGASNSREWLALFGLALDELDQMRDGSALAAHEQEVLWKVLYAVRRMYVPRRRPATSLERGAGEFPGRGREPSNFPRGGLVRLDGRLRAISVEKIHESLAPRFNIEQFFRCEIESRSSRQDDGGHGEIVIVYALRVPRQWLAATPHNEPVSCYGFWLKDELIPPAPAPVPVFAAYRVAWHPDVELGRLGMDVGLFDETKNRTAIGPLDRECFYSLLAAVGRASPDDWTRISQSASRDIVPLFNQPETQQGRLISLEGRARRALRLPVEDRDIVERFGIREYYELEVFTDDSQGNPLVCCVRELPPDMPIGSGIDEHVRVAGFFYKVWAYRRDATDDDDSTRGTVRQLAPLLVGRSATRIAPAPPERNVAAGAIAAVLFVMAMAGIWWGAWASGRSDGRVRETAPPSAP